MADTFVVDVDMAKLKSHLSAIQRRDVSEDDARQWLVNYGFYPRVDGLYLAEDAVLQKLDPSEVLAARPVGSILH